MLSTDDNRLPLKKEACTPTPPLNRLLFRLTLVVSLLQRRDLLQEKTVLFKPMSTKTKPFSETVVQVENHTQIKEYKPCSEKRQEISREEGVPCSQTIKG